MMSLKPLLSSPDLLELFVETAKHESITAGAKCLDIAPSLATRKIAQLEASLQTRLFDRTTRKVRLTESGAIALRWAQDALDAQKKVLDDISALKGTASGVVRLVTSQYFGGKYLPELLQDFCASYPRVRLSIRATDSLANISVQDFDLAIHPGVVLDSSYIGKRVQNFERVLCASPDYIARKGMPTEPRSLESHDCLTHSVNEARLWIFSHDQTTFSQSVEPLIESDNYAILLSLARSSMGVARLAYTMVRDDLLSGRLVQVMPAYECVYPGGEQPGLWLLYPCRDLPLRTRVLVDYLTEHLPRWGLDPGLPEPI